MTEKEENAAASAAAALLLLDEIADKLLFSSSSSTSSAGRRKAKRLVEDYYHQYHQYHKVLEVEVLVASALYIASVLEEQGRTQKQVADAAGVSVVAIRKGYQHLLHVLYKKDFFDGGRREKR